MKTELQVPASLSEIPLYKYQEFAKIAKDSTGEFVDRKMVSIFCDVPMNVVAKIKKYSLDDVVSHLASLFSKDNEMIREFTLKSGKASVDFGFIPDLEDITLDEYADLDSYINEWEDMHKAMAVCYRPITTKIKDKYLVSEYNGSDEFKDLMKHTPMDVVLSARLFFWNLANELVKSTRLSLVEEMEQEAIKKSSNSLRTGDGTLAFTLSLKEIFSDLKKSDGLEFPKPSLI